MVARTVRGATSADVVEERSRRRALSVVMMMMMKNLRSSETGFCKELCTLSATSLKFKQSGCLLLRQITARRSTLSPTVPSSALVTWS